MKSHSDKTADLLNRLRKLSKRILELEERSKLAENALSALVKRNEALGESIPLGIFALDKQGRITGSNSKMKHLLRWPSSDKLQSENVFEHSTVLEAGVVEKLHECLKEKRAMVAECSHTNQSGEMALLRYHIAPVFESADSVSELIVLVEDITDLKRAETAIKESESKCRLLFQFAPVAMIERDASELKTYIDHLRISGVSDLEGYLTENPQEVLHCMQLIRTVDYNNAYLKLLEAENIEEVYQSFAKETPDEYLRFALEVVLMLAEGNVWEEREEYLKTVKGNPRIVLGRALIISGHEETLSRAVIDTSSSPAKRRTLSPTITP